MVRTQQLKKTGKKILKAQKPKNGGFDAKLGTDSPFRLKSILDAAELNGIHVDETTDSCIWT